MAQSSDTRTFAQKSSLRAERFESPYLVFLGIAEAPWASSYRISIAEINFVEFGRAPTNEFRRHSAGGRAQLTISVADACMSSKHATLAKLDGGWQLSDLDSKNGSHLRGTRISQVELSDGDVFELGNTFWLFRSKVKRANQEAGDLAASSLTQVPPIARTLNYDTSRLLAQAERLAKSDLSIQLAGETGTGKELLARYIHDQSLRTGKFVAVNCGGISANLVESELFGHVKGAFSGAAASKNGYFREAGLGTIFLDEVAELSPSAQAALLRVIQEREVTPVGSSEPIQVDFRLISASHVNLSLAVEAGDFRADLFERLCGRELLLLPVRFRVEDLGLIIGTLMSRAEAPRSATFSRDCLRALLAYDWPGNVRELEHVLISVLTLSPAECITLEILPQKLRQKAKRPLAEDDKRIRAELWTSLEKNEGNISAVAREMGKARVQIRRWCKRFEIELDNFKR